VTESAPRRAALAFVFVTVVLDMLALGMIVPVLPKLIVQFEGGDTANAARIYGLFGTVWALMQLVSQPVLGALSDRYGRRPVLLLSTFGLGLDCFLMAWAPSLAWLFVGRVISGITAATFSTASAHRRRTPPEKRAGAYGLLGAAFGIGFVLGPAFGGVLGNTDPRLPFWVAGGFSLLNVLYGVFVLPESLPHERRSAFEWRRANPLGSLRLLRSHRELFGLAGANFLGFIAHEVLPSIFVLYTSYRYGWDNRTVGLFLAGVGVSGMIVSGWLIRTILARLGERRTMLTGLALGTAGFAVYGLAPTSAFIWLGVPLQAMWGLANPASMAIMTRRVPPTEQGQLQGANGSLRGVAGLIGPGLFTRRSQRPSARAPRSIYPAPLVLSQRRCSWALLGVAHDVPRLASRNVATCFAGCCFPHR
jgi:DHA1 family tetracycline resistance protein-like MFS transporter